ncbi:MAG: hypothetical protein AAGD07_02910 [Planctomycetota bacterium]
MTPSQRQSRARKRFLQWCRDHSSTPEDPNEPSIVERVLICDGFFRGRRFAADVFRGIWFLEEDILKITNENGVTLARFEADDTTIHESPLNHVPYERKQPGEHAQDQEQPQRRAA